MTGAWTAGVGVGAEEEVEVGVGVAVVEAVWKEMLDQICTGVKLNQIRGLQTGMTGVWAAGMRVGAKDKWR